MYLPPGLNCNHCTYLATGKSLQVYVSSQADNIKMLPVSSENVIGASYASSKISGSLGDNTCGTLQGQASCAGDKDGVGTFARYDTITGIALQVSSTPAATDVALYIADSANNKIRKVELTSGNYVCTTFDPNADGLFSSLGVGFLAGIAVHNPSNKLYAGGFGAVFQYDLTVGVSSKVIFAGRQIVANPLASKKERKGV